MGQSYDIKCPHCKSGFEWSVGIGMLGIAKYHCCKCGKSKNVSIDDIMKGPLRCKCGGTFEEDAPIRCPKCNQTLTDKEVKENSIIMMWD